MVILMVKCKNCGFKFPSFTQMSEVAFKTAALTNNAEECPAIVEAPNDETMMSVILATGSLGNVRSETLKAFTIDEAAKIIERL
jgi:uncharacterized protein with GYD domain